MNALITVTVSALLIWSIVFTGRLLNDLHDGRIKTVVTQLVVK